MLRRRSSLVAIWHRLLPSPPCQAAGRSSAISLRPKLLPRARARSLCRAATAAKQAFPDAVARPECVVRPHPQAASVRWESPVWTAPQELSAPPRPFEDRPPPQNWAAGRRAADRRAATAAPDAEVRPAVATTAPGARAPERVRPTGALGPAEVSPPATQPAAAGAGVEAVVQPEAALALLVPAAAAENQAPWLTAALGSAAATLAPSRLA